MEALKIEILNPKALQLIIDMQDLDLIKISNKLVKKVKKNTASDNEELGWKNLSVQKFLTGYGDDEPEYTEADIKEPNPGYKAWKEK